MRLPVTLPIQRSKLLAGALAFAHLLVAIGIFATEVPPAAKLVIAGMLAGSLVLVLRRHPFSAIVLKADGTLNLFRSGRQEAEVCRVEASTAAFPWLIVLRVRSGGRVESLTLPPDALGADGHRQLRLWLRWRANVRG